MCYKDKDLDFKILQNLEYELLVLLKNGYIYAFIKRKRIYQCKN